MDIIAHFILGLWLYRKLNKAWIVVPLSCIIDLDHVLSYLIETKKLKLPAYKMVYRTRPWFHSFTGVLAIGLPLSVIFGFQNVFYPLVGHILLDMLDVVGVQIFPPVIKGYIKGALPTSTLFPANEEVKKTNNVSHIPSIITIISFLLLIVLRV